MTRHGGTKKTLTQDEALRRLWDAKGLYKKDKDGTLLKDKEGNPITNANWLDVFLYATLKKPTVMREWNGTHPVEKNEKVHTVPAGTRVLVNMVSRFGDVGIRSRNLKPASLGYDARVQPEDLQDWSEIP